jgi:hypothetical protein
MVALDTDDGRGARDLGGVECGVGTGEVGMATSDGSVSTIGALVGATNPSASPRSRPGPLRGVRDEV